MSGQRIELPNGGTKCTDSKGTYYRDAKNFWHREDGPALEFANGSFSWYLHGIPHRVNGPAMFVKSKDNNNEWSKYWYVNGKYHRLDGPALESSTGYSEWWIDGKPLSKAEFNTHPRVKELQQLNQMIADVVDELKNIEQEMQNDPLAELAKADALRDIRKSLKEEIKASVVKNLEDSGYVEDAPGIYRKQYPRVSTKDKSAKNEPPKKRSKKVKVNLEEISNALMFNATYNPSYLHLPNDRETLRSQDHQISVEQTKTSEETNMSLKVDTSKNGWITDTLGVQRHYVNGLVHRDDDQPAKITETGGQQWYKNDKLHREGGKPALVGANGSNKYAVDGKYHRLGGQPAITWSAGKFYQEWWEYGNIIKALRRDGTTEHYAPGCTDRETAVLHNTNGPARVHANGTQEYWINGQFYPSLASWQVALTQPDFVARRVTKPSIPTEMNSDRIRDTIPTTQKEDSKGTKKMSKPTFAEMMKKGAVDAGYRVGAEQATILVKNALLTVMKNKGVDGGALQGVSAFLDTEFGKAAIALMLGTGLHYVPHFNEDPRVQRLGEEMRVGGMATVGNAVIGEAMEHLLPALSTVLQNLPSVENATEETVRVESSSKSNLSRALEEESEDDVSEKTARTMTAGG